MVSPLLNFAWSDYVSDDGNTYSIRTDSAWAANAASGCTTTSTHVPYGADTPRRHRRYALYVDSTANGRKRKLPVCTAAAATALEGGTAGQTLTVNEPGTATASTYNFAGIIAEKVPKHVIQSHAGALP
jgi:hypothetical protein